MRLPNIVLAGLAAGALLVGCSKGDDATPSTTAAPAAVTDDTSHDAAMDAAEEVLSTIRIPGAIGVFSETVQACVQTQFPQATRTDRSSLPPDQLVAQLTEALEADGWTQDPDEGGADGTETYWKDPHQLSVEVAPADDGGAKATLEVSAPRTNCG